MKKSLIATSLGLILTAAGTSAFANTGTVHFQGAITVATCPIVVQPPGGLEGGIIPMGEVPVSAFTAANQEYNPRPFELVIKDGAACNITPGDTATVMFDGPAAATDYYALTQHPGTATGVALVLRDRTGNPVTPNTQSASYPLNATGDSRMAFIASYISTSATVTAGPALADLKFTVTFI